MDKDAIYKQHIRDSIAQIEKYLGNADYKKFVNNTLVQDAVIRKLEIIGEAAKRLSPELKNNIPAVPWKKVTGTRDILIHDYISVELEEVWEIIKKDLPQLKSALK